MRTIFALLLLLVCVSARGAFTEFYANSGGTNVNAGSTTNATPLFSTTAGDWVAATGVYTKAGSDLSAVTAGMWASVYVDGATTAAFIGRITAVNDGADTITVSTTIKTGTAPADGTGTRSIRVGGAWYGPFRANGAAIVDTFPFNLVNNLLTNTSQHSVRVNFKNFDFVNSTNLVQNSNGPIRFQGYGTNAGDGVMSFFLGGNVGAGHNFFTLNGQNIDLVDLGFIQNGVSGNGTLATVAGTEFFIRGCTFYASRGVGLLMSAAGLVEECEVALCNQANSTQGAMQLSTAGIVARRCIVHDSAGTGSSGFVLTSSAILQDCVAANNDRDGATVSAGTTAYFYGCDFYNNGTNGINFTGTGAVGINVENCTFIKNGVGLSGAYAINSSGGLLRNGSILNCAFGTGTATNGNGGGNIFPGTTVDEIGSIGLASDVNPWISATTGNFTKTNTVTAVLGTGRGSFVSVAQGSLFLGTVSYPDIGATQITNSPSGDVIAYPLYRR
jgi:hypothetical protein